MQAGCLTSLAVIFTAVIAGTAVFVLGKKNTLIMR